MNKPNGQAVDLEKMIKPAVISPESTSPEKRTHSSEQSVVSPVPVPRRLPRWNSKIEALAGLEARGIARVPPEERHQGSVLGYAQMIMLWFSTNVTANNVAVGLLGPLVFDLGFVDCVMMATFGALLGSAGTAYMSIWGPQSGNRTMVCWRPLVLLGSLIPRTIRLYTKLRNFRISADNQVHYIDCGAFFHGLLACEADIPPQHHNHCRIRYHRLYHRRTDFLCCQWWEYEHRCWDHHHCAHQLACHSFWNGCVPNIPKVWVLLVRTDGFQVSRR